jgi:hypothetical protein
MNKEKTQHSAKNLITITQKIIKKLMTPEVVLRGGNIFIVFLRCWRQFIPFLVKISKKSQRFLVFTNFLKEIVREIFRFLFTLLGKFRFYVR